MYQDSPGIYKIVNTVNGHFYIGSTFNLGKRRNRHFSELRLETHYNIHLQRSFKKYGENKFYFVPIIICDIDNLAIYEQILIDGLHPHYNIRKDATSNKGVTKSEYEKIRVGNMFRNKKLSKEHIYNRGKSRTMSNIEKNPMANIEILPGGKYRFLIDQKHLGCFIKLKDAQLVRTSYFSRKFGGGLDNL